mmetsp:Transcript_82948/g.238385  ORF Transcript_82948/g.238385 Transcript_82948/m.238385 type:complete len:468 (+) Transcript_82948:131-1534(+)
MPAADRQGSARKRALSPFGRTWMNGLYAKEMNVPEPTITAVIYFDTPPSRETCMKEFEEHIWPLYRFNSRVENDNFLPIEGPMDRSYHFSEQEVAGEADVDAYAQSVMTKPLLRTHPLWTVTLVRARQGRSAVVLRVHHVISDGLGLLFAFLPLMKCEDGDVLQKIPLPAMLLGKHAARARPPSGAPPRDRAPRKRCVGPISCLAGVCKAVQMFLRGVFSILLMKEDAELKCNASKASRKPFLPYNGQRVFTRMPPVPTSAIKAVRTAHGCTFNDAIMAAMSGAFRRYLQENLKDPLAGSTECKAFMLLGLPRPVDPKDASVSLANSILTPVFKLPIGEASPRGRLRQTIVMCNDLKSMWYIMGIKMTTKFLTSVVPTGIMRSITSEAVSKCTANITNLPLPDVPTTFCGQEMKDVQCLFVNAIPQISMLSYNNFLHWNVVADPAVMPNAEALGRHLIAEFDALAQD